MGIGYTYFLKAINTLQIIVLSVKNLQRLQLVRAGIEKKSPYGFLYRGFYGFWLFS